MVQREREKKKYIYNSILCRIFIGLCAVEVMLCTGRAQRSLPCDHYTLSCTDDPWLIWLIVCFFMSSAFFAINAFDLKLTFSSPPIFLTFCSGWLPNQLISLQSWSQDSITNQLSFNCATGRKQGLQAALKTTAKDRKPGCCSSGSLIRTGWQQYWRLFSVEKMFSLDSHLALAKV